MSKGTKYEFRSINGGNIDVIVSGDKVILTGKVRSFSEKCQAETAAWSASGVHQVGNKLEVGQAEA